MSIRFYCIFCGAKYSAEDTRGEHVIECAGCRHIIPVPAPADVIGGPAMTAFPRDVLALELKFLCSGCGVKLGVDARWEGRSIQCPECEAGIEIPRWSRRQESAASAILTVEEVAFLSADGEADGRLRSA